MLLAIDPGIDTGWALYLSTGTLLDCGLGHPRQSHQLKCGDLARVVIEHPMIYPGSPVDPNSIVRLAVNAGRWGGVFESFADVTYVLPRRWKGSVPKNIHQVRILGKLSPEERKTITQCVRISNLRPERTPIPQGKKHNMLDAIGLGLYALGRL